MAIIDKFAEFDKNPVSPKRDETSKEVMTKTEAKKEKHYIRTLGDVAPAAEAQRIYNPAIPPMRPKGPTAAQTELGTSQAMGTEGNWGKAE